MTENSETIPVLDFEKLKSFIISKEPPVYESTLLKEFFEIKEINATDPVFFRAHFKLMNALYQIADQMAKEGNRLYIFLGMIYFRKGPKAGQCRFFDEETRDFCRKQSVDNSELCLLHSEVESSIHREGEAGKVRPLTIRDYYLNEENLEKTTQQDLEDIMSGAFFLIGSTEEIEESLSVMSLPYNFSEQRLKQRYRHLAGELHPDKPDGDSQEFIKVEKAYSILLKLVRFRSN